MAVPVYIKPVLVLLVSAIIVSSAVVVLRDSSHVTTAARPVAQSLPNNIDVALKDARFSEIQDGKVVWELAASKVAYDKSGDVAYLTGITVIFQKTESHGEVTITADSGDYRANEKNIHLTGHVHVVTEDGVSFTTDSVLYTGSRDLLSTRDLVSFRQQRLQLTAVGMELGIKNQRARFYSKVDAAILPQ